ncbi:MAG: FtsB family cell division protein [Candidatus Dormibacteraceae bacterium]
MQPRGITRQGLLLIGILLVGVWMAWSLEQEVALSWQLNQDAARLRQQNIALAAANADYHRDIQSVTTGAVAEEEARLRGYARPNEKVYLVTNQISTETEAPAAPTTNISSWAALWRWLVAG